MAEEKDRKGILNRVRDFLNTPLPGSRREPPPDADEPASTPSTAGSIGEAPPVEAPDRAREKERGIAEDLEKGAREATPTSPNRSVYGQARTPEAPQPDPAPPPAAPTAQPEPAPRTYTVQRGDTLRAVAQRFYGDEMAWRRIYEANRDKIENPDLIYPGQEFVIPEA